MNIFGGLAGLGSVAQVQLEWRRAYGRPVATAAVRGRAGETDTLPVFSNKDSIVGDVKATPIPGKRADHQGIRVQLIGQIELAAERGHPHDFVSLARDLSPPGELTSQQLLPFEFNSVEMEHDSYRGLQVRLRYLLRVTISRPYGASVVRDFPFWVRNHRQPEPQASLPPVKMEVGIEDCLHIEFEYSKGKYHLSDTVVGKIYFLLVRIRLKHMEIEIRRRETTGSGSASHHEMETLAKFEIMDGAPVRGENIPIRMYLTPYDLTPTYRNVHNKFSVRYSLNLVLVDQEDRRYFKQQEIELYRAAEAADGSGAAAASPPMPSHGRAPAPAAASPAPASAPEQAPAVAAAPAAPVVPAAASPAGPLAASAADGSPAAEGSGPPLEDSTPAADA
jgi:vacuolar protein sorting-associated protein 26